MPWERCLEPPGPSASSSPPPGSQQPCVPMGTALEGHSPTLAGLDRERDRGGEVLPHTARGSQGTN